MNYTDTEISAFETMGGNKMTVAEDSSGIAYTFDISARTVRNTKKGKLITHTVMISVEEAVALAETILGRGRDNVDPRYAVQR